jgi:hypothetical protein
MHGVSHTRSKASWRLTPRVCTVQLSTGQASSERYPDSARLAAHVADGVTWCCPDAGMISHKGTTKMHASCGALGTRVTWYMKNEGEMKDDSAMNGLCESFKVRITNTKCQKRGQRACKTFHFIAQVYVL